MNQKDKIELSARFQPIMGGDRIEPFGWEGLIRGPKGSMVESPLILFAAAGKNLPAWEWKALTLLCETFKENDPGGKLFLNISPNTLLSEKFSAENLQRYLSNLQLSPHRIVFELTEHAIVKNDDQINECILPLRALGIQFAIDNFGSGFNNFTRWKYLKPNYLKFDHSLTHGIHANMDQQIIVEAFFNAARGINSLVIAEGVEDPLDAEWLESRGTYFFPFVQGYYYGMPQELPASNSISESPEKIQQSA